MNVNFTPSIYLSGEVNFNLFSNLRAKELALSGKVSRNWKIISNDERLWQQIWSRILPGTSIPTHYTAKQIVAQYVDRIVDSFPAIQARFKEFCSSNSNSAFECIFPMNPNCRILLEIRHKNEQDEPQVKDFCVFKGRLSSSTTTHLRSSTAKHGDCDIEITYELPSLAEAPFFLIKDLVSDRVIRLPPKQRKRCNIRHVTSIALGVFACMLGYYLLKP